MTVYKTVDNCGGFPFGTGKETEWFWEVLGTKTLIVVLLIIFNDNVMPQIVIIITKLDSNLEIVFHNDVVNVLP